MRTSLSTIEGNSCKKVLMYMFTCNKLKSPLTCLFFCRNGCSNATASNYYFYQIISTRFYSKNWPTEKTIYPSCIGFDWKLEYQLQAMYTWPSALVLHIECVKILWVIQTKFEIYYLNNVWKILKNWNKYFKNR